MTMIRRLFERNKAGFTLVELMAVVLIIGILVAIAIPMYQNSSKNAQNKTCKANIRTILSAVEQYRSVAGTTPASIAALEGTYLKVTPVCPFGPAYALDGSGAVVETTHYTAVNDFSKPDTTHLLQ